MEMVLSMVEDGCRHGYSQKDVGRSGRMQGGLAWHLAGSATTTTMVVSSVSEIEALDGTHSTDQLVHAVPNEDWILQSISLFHATWSF